MAVYSKMNNIKPRNQIVQEAYFGKTSEIQEAEKILGQWRSKYYGSGNRFITSAAADPLFYEFCDKMADIFGFAEYLVVLKGEAMQNSATIPVGVLFTGQDAQVTKTKTGYKYDGTPVMLQYCYPYMLFDERITDGEVMAVFLHEIGHNFSHKANTLICIKHILTIIRYAILLVFELLTNPIGAIGDTFLITNEGRKVYKAFQSACNEDEAVSYVISLLKFILALPTTVLINIYSITNKFASPLAFVFTFFKNLLRNGILGITIGIQDERIADNFATVYGYGPELYTALHKLGINSVSSVSTVHKLPVAGWIYDLLDIPQSWLLQLSNEHPTTDSRRKAQIRYLEAEMKKDGITPSARKMILKDLKQFDSDLTDIEKRARKLGGSAVIDKYVAIVNSLNRGDDPRELFFNYDRDVERMDRLGESTTIDTSIIDNVDLL